MMRPPRHWTTQALAALDSDAVWSIYTDAVYQSVERIILDGNKARIAGAYTSDGQSRTVPIIPDPIPYILNRLWQRGEHYGALMFITGLWLRVRTRQRGQIPWPVDDLLDGLRFYLRSTTWTDADHREFSQMFWTHIAEPTIGGHLNMLLEGPDDQPPH